MKDRGIKGIFGRGSAVPSLVQTAYRRGRRTREDDDRGIKGIFGELVAFGTSARLQGKIIVGGFRILSNNTKESTISAACSLNRAKYADQFPKPSENSAFRNSPPTHSPYHTRSLILPPAQLRLPSFLSFRGQPPVGLYQNSGVKSRPGYAWLTGDQRARASRMPESMARKLSE